MLDPYGYTDEEYDALVLSHYRLILKSKDITPEEELSWWK